MPKVSIIVTAVKGDPSRDCLDSLLHQTVGPETYEIIIVGDISSEFCSQLKRNEPSPSIRTIQKPADRLVAGLNQALLEAVGDYLLFIDAGVRASSSLVFEHLQFQQAGDVIVLGNIQQSSHPDWKADTDRSLKGTDFQQSGASWLDCQLVNLSIPRKSILEVGGFCEDLRISYDLYLAYRLEQHGLPVVRINAASVTLGAQASHRYRLRKEERRGAACVELWRKNPQLLPLLFPNFYDTSPRGILLRRLLVAFSIPIFWMAAPGFWLGKRAWRDKWEEFFQQASFWRGVRTALADRNTWDQLTHGVPILMYHAFCMYGEQPSRYIHSIDRFRLQLKLLKLLGYQIIRLEDYLQCVCEKKLPPRCSIVLTMDDGYIDNPAIAYSVLKQYNAPATIFLVSNYLGKKNDWDKDSLLTGRETFSAEIARQLQTGLIDFGAHTHTHPWLQRLSKEKAREEIETSKRELESLLRTSIRSFSYPHGDFNDLTPKLVEEAGFWGACTTQTGLNTPGCSCFTLYRTEIRGSYSILRFLKAVWFGK